MTFRLKIACGLLFLVAYCVGSSGCASNPFWPSSPTSQIEPLPMYERWYHEAEACRNLNGRYETLSFYLVNNLNDRNDEFVKGDHSGIVGMHSHNRIFILAGLEKDEPLVKHEMLHNILSYYISKKDNAAHRDSLAFYGEKACDLSP